MFHLPFELVELVLDHFYFVPVAYSPDLDDNLSWELDSFKFSGVDLFENLTGTRRASWSDFSDVLSLSLTCRLARSILTRRLFHTLHLTTSEENCKSILEVSQSYLREFVVDLRYQAFADTGDDGYLLDQNGERIEEGDALWTNPPQPTGDEPKTDYDNPEHATKAFPFELGQVLAHLDRFPHLQNLFVETDDLFNGLDLYHLEEMFNCRRDSPWPFFELIGKSFDAISKNPPGSFISLQIPYYSLFHVEVFEKPQWHDIMSHLKHFSFSWPDWYNEIHSTYRFAAFHDSHVAFTRNFIGRLRDIEDLTVKANQSLVTGDLDPPHEYDRDQLLPEWFGDPNEIPKGFPQPPEMPWLRRVHFSWMTLDPKLTGFMIQRIERLEVIELDHCISVYDEDESESDEDDSSSSSYSDENSSSQWLEFLNSLVAAKPKKLRRLQLPSLAEWDGLKGMNKKKYSKQIDWNPELRLKVLSALEKDDRLFLFGHRQTPELCEYRPDDVRVLRSIITGEEQQAYEKVLRMIESRSP